MRFTAPTGVQFQEHEAPHTLHFAGSGGERLRITVLEHDLVRVQHHPDGQPRLNRTWMVVGSEGHMPREGRQRDDLSPFSTPDFSLQENTDSLELRTDALRLRIHPGKLRLEWYNADNTLFAEDVPRIAYAYNRAGGDVFHYLRRYPGEHYYGFGERSGALSKAGRRMRMLNLDSLGYNAETGDPLYKHFPFYITFLPDQQIAYGLFYDNLATSVFDMGKEIDAYHGLYRYYQAHAGDLDYYVLYGPSIPDVLDKFTRLTGRPALPPRWTLGYLGSTMSYTEAPDAQEQLKQFAQLTRQHDIPCDMFHLSSGYTTDEDGKRCVFTWNRSKVPQPEQMVQHFHDAGIRLAPNVKPYMLKTHPNYDEVAGKGGFIQQAASDAPEISTFWSGGAMESDDGAYLDFTSEAGYDWWQERLQATLLDYGMDAVWNDNNEYELWDDEARCAGYGEPIPIGQARPLQTLLMGHASYHALLKHQPDERPFVLTRSACPGMQRYAQTWSGDNTTSWNDLRYNIPMGLGLSLSGMPNTGHDVGGFHGPKPEPELLVRWVQNHIFHPRFCIHSWNTDGTVTEPWMYPQVLPLIRDAIQLRYRLIPYLYTLFKQAADTGQPIMRPLLYHFPQDERCHTESFQFMLGPNLMVASVIERGARSKDVYLPRGTQWCDFHSGTWYAGGQTITVQADLDHIPLFVPAGAMLPMSKVMQHVGAEADDMRELYLFLPPAGGDGHFTLYEDDGLSFAYQRGQYATLDFQASADEERITLNVTVDNTAHVLSYGEVRCVLPPNETRQFVTNQQIKQEIRDQNAQYVLLSIG